MTASASADSALPSVPPAPAPDAPLVALPGVVPARSKAQQEFDRLNASLARLREQLAAWQAASDALDRRRRTEWLPVYRKLLAAQRDAVLWIDAYLTDPPPGERLHKRTRAKLPALLRLWARAVLDEDGGDAETEAAYDRHAARPWRDCGTARPDVPDADDAAPSARPEPPDPPPAARPGREEKARLRDARALQEAKHSLREVFRRLASRLHPDREPDPVAREHKTAAMARANQAYAADDLPTLLAMQRELEASEAVDPARFSDERLRRYNRALKEQLRALEAELAALQPPSNAAARRPRRGDPAGSPPTASLEQGFAAELRALRAAVRQVADDLALLRDPRTREAFLQVIQVEDPEDERGGGPSA